MKKIEINYSQADRNKFLQLIQSHNGILETVINKYGFTRDRQEMMIYCWSKFYTYQRDDYKFLFSTWLYNNAHWGLLAYRAKEKKHYSRFVPCDNISSWCDAVDTSYSEEHIEALRLAIKDLPTDKTEAVELRP